MNLEHFDEPNLGTVVGDEFYFIANSHWNRFDRDGNLPEGGRPVEDPTLEEGYLAFMAAEVIEFNL